MKKHNFIFKKGDLISSLDKKDVRVITGYHKDGISYEYMLLTEKRFQDIFNAWHTIEKGSNGSQPADIVERYFCLYQIK